MELGIKVLYMLNGLMIIGEVVEVEPNLKMKLALALVPGDQQGRSQFIEAFPFTAVTETVKIEPGSYIAITSIRDPKLLNAYEDAVKKVRAHQSGLIMP